MELGGGNDRPRHRAAGDEALLLTLAGVVRVAFHAIGAHDREQHVVTDPGAFLGGQQVPGRGPEVRHRLVPVGGLGTRGVHDGLHAGQGGVQAVPGHQVHAQ